MMVLMAYTDRPQFTRCLPNLCEALSIYTVKNSDSMPVNHLLSNAHLEWFVNIDFGAYLP